MSTRIYGGSGLAVLAAIVVAAFIFTNPLSTEASVDDTPVALSQGTNVSNSADTKNVGQTTRPDGLGQLQISADTGTETKPYIGVVIQPLSDGTVEVVKVLKDGPSDGVLESEDVITAVDGETIDGAEDLTQAIAETGSGETLTLTITRDGSEMDVVVTVGEWTEKSYRKSGAFHRPGRVHDQVASAQVVKADDDGNYHTYRTVFGSVTALDETAGTLTLQPKDGSDEIAYTVDDDTRIYVGKELVDDLSGLDAEMEIVVMDVDGEVKVIKQGDAGRSVGFRHRMGRIHGFGPGVGASFHRTNVRPARVADIRKMIDRWGVDVPGRMRGLRSGMDLSEISSFLDEIDDNVIATYAPDGFEESLERFLEDAGSGGSISVRRDGDGLNISLQTEDGVMNLIIPSSALNDDSS
ncbi:MAG: PDZ domain-containing protein [Dehalococcoidia bacterium]|nr:PDZ domain-containing protein [Dehalococcoidia bacterium]